jgi:hypothetical protein
MKDPNTPDLFPEFGTHTRELVRTEDPDTSHEAAQKVDTARLEQMVYEVILSTPTEQQATRSCVTSQTMACRPSAHAMPRSFVKGLSRIPGSAARAPRGDLSVS